MRRYLAVLLVFVFACQGISLDGTPFRNNVRETFMQAFHSPECDQPCWLGIEVGVTNHETVVSILEEEGIEYGVPGVIHLYSIPDGTVPGIQPDGAPAPGNSPNVFGDINIGQSDEDIVFSFDFGVDLCVSTIVAAYGEPGIWFTEYSIPSTLVYREQQVLFIVDTHTRRIRWMIFHQIDSMPQPDELADWSAYTDMFSGECLDEFTPPTTPAP